MWKTKEGEERRNLLLAKEVTDLDGGVAVGNAGVNGEVSVDEPHLVAVALGDAGDEVPDVAEGGADGGGGLAGPEPRVDLQLPIAVLVGDELEVQVQVLEVTDQLPPGALNLDDLGVNLDAHAVGDVHRLRRKDRLHFCNFEGFLSLSSGSLWVCLPRMQNAKP